ncbi:MAG: DUF1269 domain-containing protein [Planctomycetota bacterium]
MATISVLKFNTPDGADAAKETVFGLARDHMIELHDGAIVKWPNGKKRPRTEQFNDLTGAGAMGGAFWGLLFGVLFFMPLAGMLIGAGMGALSGSMADVGIHDDFIDKIKKGVTEGTSCLFLMTSNAVEDRVVEALSEHEFEVIATNLSKEQEDALRHAFAADEA